MSTMRDSRTTNSAMISVIERARGRSEARPTARLFAVVLMAAFFITLMGGLAAGASLYRTVTRAQDAASAAHLQAGLLTNIIHNNDTAGALTSGEGPEGPALVLMRRTRHGAYETRIYAYEGSVVQEFSVAGRPYDPQGATPLLASDSFSFDVTDGLVSIKTDQGSFDVALRSDPTATPQEDEPVAAPQLETITDDGGAL